MSTIDSEVQWPTIRPRVRRSACPPAIRATSSEVPPRSHVTTSGSPSARAIWLDAAAPADGPDWARPIGAARAPSTVVAPPFECVSTIGAVSPLARSASPSGPSQSSEPPT